MTTRTLAGGVWCASAFKFLIFRGGLVLNTRIAEGASMELGAFSNSLAVKDLGASNDETSTGPASFTTVDPDGNPILVDQHV
jgi:hypothetical protein